MRILLVSTGFPPDRIGGIENYVSMLYHAFRRKEDTVKVVTRLHRIGVSNPDIVQIPTFKGELRGYGLWAAQAWIETKRRRYDIIHYNGFEGQILSLMPLKVAPSVVHIHNSLTKEQQWYRKDPVRHSIGYSIAAGSFLNADTIVAPTQTVKEDLMHHLRQIREERIRVIPNCIDSEYYRRELVQSNVREKHKLGERFVVLYFGKVKPTKGIEEICEASRILGKKTESTLMIAGAYSQKDPFTESLKIAYKDVIFTGFVPDPRPYYAAADAFVIYTKGFEGGEVFPIALLEAMSMGLPIVCSDNPTFREITRGNALFARPNDPESLAQCLSRLADSRSEALRMGKEGRRLAETTYDVRTVASEVRTAYEDLIG